MKILVMGAGAVGAYFGARLRAAGEDVVLCARGENLRAIRERGLDITSIRGDLRIEVKATDTPREFAPYDLILFCVKAYDTDTRRERHRGMPQSRRRDSHSSKRRRERGQARRDLRPRRRHGRQRAGRSRDGRAG